MKKIDLHIHSMYSEDADFSTKEIVKICLENDVGVFAVADHNSIAAQGELKDYFSGSGLCALPAVELDCMFGEVQPHILGYGIDWRAPVFGEIHDDYISQEQKNSRRRIENIRKLGISFSDDTVHALSKFGIVTGEMIGEAALEYDNNNENPLLDPYRPGGSRSDNPYVNFYWDFCGPGKPGDGNTIFISLDEAIKTISDTGGIAVMAHPGHIVHEDKSLLDKIINRGIKGLEVFSSYHSGQQTDFYLDYAKKHNLLITCGSDFHGKTKPAVVLGGTDCRGMEEEIVANLLNAINN